LTAAKKLEKTRDFRPKSWEQAAIHAGFKYTGQEPSQPFEVDIAFLRDHSSFFTFLPCMMPLLRDPDRAAAA